MKIAAITKTENYHLCPECGNFAITSDYEIVCSSCGLVIEQFPIYKGTGKSDEPEFYHYYPGAKFGRRDNLTFLNYTKPNFMNSPYANNRTLIREKRALNFLKALKNYFPLQDWQINQILYRYLKIRKDHKIINDFSLLSTLFYKIMKEYQIYIKLEDIVKITTLYGHHTSKKTIKRDMFEYNLIKPIFNKSDFKNSKLIYYTYFFDRVFESQDFINRMIKKNINLEDMKKETKKTGLYIIYKPTGPMNYPNFCAAVIYSSILIYAEKHQNINLISKALISKILGIPDHSITYSYLSHVKPISQSKSFILSQHGESIRSPFFSNKKISIKQEN